MARLLSCNEFHATYEEVFEDGRTMLMEQDYSDAMADDEATTVMAAMHVILRRIRKIMEIMVGSPFDNGQYVSIDGGYSDPVISLEDDDENPGTVMMKLDLECDNAVLSWSLDGKSEKVVGTRYTMTYILRHAKRILADISLAIGGAKPCDGMLAGMYAKQVLKQAEYEKWEL